MEQGNQFETDCRSIGEILSRIGDKWSIMLVMELHGGKKRFSELRRALIAISQKVLTSTLRGLERDGYVKRTIYPTIPPKVEYELTELGRELFNSVKLLGDFAVRNRASILHARDQFDTQDANDSAM